MTINTIKTNSIMPYSVKWIKFENSTVGFGSTMLYLLGMVEYCIRHEIDFHFNPKGVVTLYLDEPEDPWHSIFKPNCFDVRFNHPRKHGVITHLPKSSPFFDYMFVCDDSTLFISDKWSGQFHHLLTNYMNYTDEFSETIKNDALHLVGKNVLGVHLRGTDHGDHGKILTLENRLNQLKTVFSQGNFDTLFLMTDETAYLRGCIDTFGDRVMYLKDVVRSGDRSSLHHHRKYQNGRKVLSDVIREVNMLSRCNYQMFGRSGVSAFARCLNPNIPYRLFHEDISSHDLAGWKNSLSMGSDVAYITLR